MAYMSGRDSGYQPDILNSPIPPRKEGSKALSVASSRHL